MVEEAARDQSIPLITTVPTTWTPDAGRAFIDRQNSRLSDGEGWSLAILERASQRAIGQIGLWISHLHNGRADLGYWIVPSSRGRGAASEALQALSDWAFDHLDVDRLSLYIQPTNTASIKTAVHAGFEYEALLRSWERIGGTQHDMWSYVRIRPHRSA